MIIDQIGEVGDIDEIREKEGAIYICPQCEKLRPLNRQGDIKRVCGDCEAKNTIEKEMDKMDTVLYNFLARVAPITHKMVYVNSDAGIDDEGNTLCTIEVEDDYGSVEGAYTDTEENIDSIIKEYFRIDEDESIVDIIYLA